MNSKKMLEADPRINVKISAWVVYVMMLGFLMASAGGFMLITYVLNDVWQYPNQVTVTVTLLYWIAQAVFFYSSTAFVRRQKFDEPLLRMSQAARQVAKGDFSVHIPPIRKDGKKDYIELMFDDFNSMVRELNSTELLTNDFVANVSHEIKTPLSTIQSYALLLQRNGIADAQRREYTDTIIAASETLNTLVVNVLKLSKLENQAIPPAPEDFDLCAQLIECALGFEGIWESKNITFEAHMDEKAMIRADKEMLAIVWNNLLSNALKFTEPGGTVTLAQTSAEDCVTVTVTDTGCGMDEATLRHIFEKFYQGDTSRVQEGNGLGLALALCGVRLSGGELAVKSKPGEGSAFTVTLKAKP